MNEQQESWDNMIRGGGIVAAVFVFTLFIYFVCQQFLDSAQGRIKPVYGATDSAKTTLPATSGQGGYAPVGMNIPRVTAGYIAPNRIPPPIITPPTAFTYRPGDLIFSSNAEQASARAAVRSLKIAVQNVRRYDGASFWQALPGGTTASLAISQKAGIGAGADGDGSRLFPANTEDVAKQRQKALTRITNETEALATELVLVTHPSLFPEGARDAVDAVSVEARTYLSTVQLSLARPENRAEFQSLAQGHLARAEAALHTLESAVGGLDRPDFGSGAGMN